MILYGFNINTIHLAKGRSERWFKTRKPILQLEILACLVLQGKQSKGMIESLLKHREHADILSAFKKLEDKHLIKRLNEIRFARGRRQYYYKITEKGLELLIKDDPHPLKFWKALFGYCHHYEEGLTEEMVDKFYNLFKENYLRYRSHSFSFQLDVFDNMCDKWLSETILRTDTLRLEQKVIEVLAINPGIAFEELTKNTGGKESDVKRCLSSYTLESSYKPLMDKTVYMHKEITGERYNKKYWDFLLHSTIRVKQNSEKNTKTYELSLFGVILALILVRYCDMDKLKHGLYYDNISFADYYDKIASNYKDKLPLIFGKWNILKNFLGLFSAYNFDIILNKEIRLRDSDKFSICRGGNKELLDSIREIAMQTRLQLGEIANAGREVWPEFIPSVPSVFWKSEYEGGDYLMQKDVDFKNVQNSQKVSVVKRKLYEIILSLNPIEYDFFKQSKVVEKISHQLEKEFAHEVTALYYFQLYFDYEFNERFNTPAKYYSSSIKLDDDNQFPVSSTPKDCLFLVLQNDKEKPLISEWYYRCTQDISNLQEEAHKASKLMTQDIGKYLTSSS